MAEENQKQEFVYNEESAKKALNLLLDNADQLEQVSRNLSKLLSDITEGVKEKVFGIAVKSVNNDNQYPHYLEVHGRKKEYTTNTGVEIQDYNFLYSEAKALITDRQDKLADYVGSIGELAHKVNLDIPLGEERSKIGSLVGAIFVASNLLEEHINKSVTIPENKASLVQARRDSKFLKDLAADLGEDAGRQIVEYNRGLVEREASLVTKEDIEGSRAKKWTEGMEKLVASAQTAEKNDPSFRKLVEERRAKPSLPVIER